MRKTLLSTILLFWSIFFATHGETTGTANININVTIQSLSVSITSNETWNMGVVGAGSTTTMTNDQKIIVLNNGNGPQTYTLQVTNTGGTWTAGETEAAIGPDKFVLSGVFSAATDTGIVAANINTGTNDDVIKSTARIATATTYAANTNATANGVSVPPGETRALWLQFKAPTSSSVTTQQTIVVTIGVVGR